ncbi:MAG: TetR/AcrR family transcriptional regulator [Thermoplasmata archaeon]|nr:TetR/AcrR family transcriptional regulator [Thermoplasmata archaeon]
MGRYDRASTKTELAIQEAYWRIYENGDTATVTVDEICDEAGVHRSTFYHHFKSVEAASDSIKERQMSLLKDLFERTGGKNVDFTAFIPAFQELFDENERYLVPLVKEYGTGNSRSNTGPTSKI